MVMTGLEYFERMNGVTERLNRVVVDTTVINIDEIERRIAEKLKREIQGKTSYGLGVR